MKTDELKAEVGAIKSRRIGVVMGGLSAERDVSLETGSGVAAALSGRGYDCVAIDWAPGTSLPQLLERERIQVVWNALHGTYGEDGAVQGLCACMQIACTGSGILASALAMDKIASKRQFESHGVPTPTWRILPRKADAAVLAEIPVPAAIKPSEEGSSVGVSIVFDREALPAAVELARRHRGETLIEEYIPGAEIHIGILDGDVLGTIEVRPAKGFYDYEAKYQRNDTQYIIPATLPPEHVGAAERVAASAYRALGCAGHSRVDLRVRADGTAFCLEVNTLPGMTSHSLLPKIAAHRGMDYASLCERILASAS